MQGILPCLGLSWFFSVPICTRISKIASALLALSGPNRAMQLRCAMRFESHTPKSLAMRKRFFASDAKTHSLDLTSQENSRKQPAKILRRWPAMRKIRVFFKIERCEMPAIRTPAAVWPAMRVPAMPNR